MTVVPYKNSGQGKKEQVEKMFDQISYRYDFLNHLLSLNVDKLWRRKAVRLLKQYKPTTILDIATGTADFAIAAARLNLKKIVGIDISERMLEAGRKKVQKKGMSEIIELHKGDSECLSFQNDLFDAAIVGFGVRNFENLKKGLSEIYRVIRPGGVFIVLEFSIPKNKIFRRLYFFYFLKLIPWIGRIVSKDNNAYQYLPESVREFPYGDRFIDILKETGFEKCSSLGLTMGIAAIYKSEKPKN